jgi:lipopolysaccharide heptosyltransferase II
MKILIRLPNWLGDVIMSTAFIDAVKHLYPEATIDVIIKKELSEIASLIPGINTVHPYSKQEYNGLSGIYRFGEKLRVEKYDLFFNLPSSLSSALMARATGVKKRVGFGKEGGFFLLTNSYKKPGNVHRVDEYISLLQRFTGKTIDNYKVKLNADKTVQRNNNRVLINFNSEADSRRMPLHKAKIILKSLTNTFTNSTFTFIGSPKEAAFIEQVIEGAENTDRIENLAGKTNLVTLCSLMAASRVVLTTDSGPAHLANSLGTPTIVLFGAGNEYNTAPYNKQNLTILRNGTLKCEPCVKNSCELYGIPKCMELINELLIIDALSVYLPNA